MHVTKSKEKGFFDIQILPDSISASPFPTPSTPTMPHHFSKPSAAPDMHVIKSKEKKF